MSRNKVLLADDSPLARDILSRRVEATGLVALACESAAVARGEDATDLACALLDIDLGDGDGTEVAETLRATRPDLPVAFFSSAAPEASARARTLGPVFAKPDDLEAAVAWVHNNRPPS